VKAVEMKWWFGGWSMKHVGAARDVDVLVPCCQGLNKIWKVKELFWRTRLQIFERVDERNLA
jgi:hypothetical protein